MNMMRLMSRLDSLFVYSMQNEGTLTCTAMCATESSAPTELSCLSSLHFRHISHNAPVLELTPALKYRNESYTAEEVFTIIS